MYESEKTSREFWTQPQKAAEEAEREKLFIDDIIQKSHIEKELLKNLDGINTAFDGGAGTGRFSILLARRGVKVTHFDISRPMIDKAKELAGKQGVLGNMEFVEGSLEDLSMFSDKQFDLVMSFDAPISYTYPYQEIAIRNLIRIARRKIIISVSSRLGSVPYFFNPAQKAQYTLDKSSDNALVKYSLDSLKRLGGFTPDIKEADNVFHYGVMGNILKIMEESESGGKPWPVTYAFMPDELKDLMEKCGAWNVKLAGPGALSRSIPNEVLVTIMKDEKMKSEFLDLCYEYDRKLWVCGFGKDNLLASADLE